MTQERTYGNWLRPQKLSIRGIGWRGALFAVGTYLVGLIALQYDARAGLTTLAACLLVTTGGAARVGGATLGHALAAKARWVWANTRGRRDFRAIQPDAGPTGWALPGPLARTEMVQIRSGAILYGAVHDRVARRIAVTLLVASTAADLTDTEEQDAAVGRWERWLEGLGRHPEVAWVSVAVDTAPSPGTRLRDVVTHRLAPTGPPDCRALTLALVEASPAVAARTDTRVTLTFDLRAWDTQVGRRGRREGVTAYAAPLDQAVAGLESALDGCGVTVVGRATPAELAAAVRVAYDPAASGEVERALGDDQDAVPEWEFAGPMTAHERRDHYLHDSGVSASFVWAQAPRQLVTSSVLDPLVRPGRHRRRFTCTYFATPSTAAMDAATTQVRWRWMTQAVSRLPVIGRAGTAQDDRDADAAEQATREVAAGAGWVTQTITVTVTVLDPAELPAAVAELEHAAGAAQLRLRRLSELQAAGFAAGLPAGLSLAELARRWDR